MVSLEEFLNDQTLVRGLKSAGNDPRREISRGLELAVARQTFLRYEPGPEDQAAGFYLLNTESDRNALSRIKGGGSPAGQEETVPSGGFLEQPAGDRPNVFALYEDNVGMLTPILAEKLKEAEELYPRRWLGEAFAIAAAENKRSWSYISAILRRWAAEGKDHGEPGRHSKTDHRQKYIEDYQRRWGPPSGEGAGR